MASTPAGASTSTSAVSSAPNQSAVDRAILLCAALAVTGAVVWAVYGSAVRTPFVFDDDVGITENSSIVQLWPLVGSATAPGPLNPPKELTTSGRPLINLSFALNYYFGQLNPAGYHTVNLVLHVLSAVLLMLIVQRSLCLEYFGGRFAQANGPLAFAVGLLWALHPLQSETVIYVTQRTELMVAFFYFATLYGSLRYWTAPTSGGRTAWMMVATAACLAGMACKEMMVTAPVMVLLYERTFISKTFRQALQKSWPLYAGLALGWVFLYILNRNGPRSGTAGFGLELPATTWWFTQAKVFWMYLKLCIWPWPLAVHYELPYFTTVGQAWPWLFPALVVGIGTLVLLWRRNAVGYVGAWLLIILSPTLVVPIITEVAAERRMYLPLAALAALAVVGSYWLVQQALGGATTKQQAAKENPLSLRIVCVAALVLAIVWSLIDVRRLAAYYDPVILWQETVAYQPDDPLARYNFGRALADVGRYEDVLVQTNEALRLKPDSNEAHNNLGNALLKLGRYDEAIAHYKQSLEIKPDYAEAYLNLGTALYHQGKFQEAIAQYEKAIELKPNYADAHSNLGAALAREKRLQDAVDEFELALRYKPTSIDAHLQLGITLAQMSRMDEAVDQFKQTLRIKPDSLDAYSNLTTAYAQMQRPTEAIAAAENAAALARASGQMGMAEQIERWVANYRIGQHMPPGNSPSPGPTHSSP